MIRPEPITLNGRSGMALYLDAHGEPVGAESPLAVTARAIFDDGERRVLELDAFDRDPSGFLQRRAAGARGAAALTKFGTVKDGDGPVSVKAVDVFGAPAVKIKVPLNLKTTANSRQKVRLRGLEPTRETIPLDGVNAYLRTPRVDPPDVLHVVMRNGRERYIIQEGHTRLAAAALRGEDVLDARVWEFEESPTGELVPVPRGLQKRGMDKSQLNLEGTTEGAIKGWETRRGGGTGHGVEEHLSSPKDAVHSLLNGEKVNIAREDVLDFLKAAGKTKEDPDLTDVHVDGMQIFGGNGLGVSRADMPQIPKENREDFLHELKAQGIKTTRETVSPLTLAPTQKEVSARLVQEKREQYQEDKHRDFPPLLVAQDGHVLDGHHHWGLEAALAAQDKSVKVPIIRIHQTVQEALDFMHAYDALKGIKGKPLLRTHRIAASYREKLVLLLAGEWEAQHPRDDSGESLSYRAKLAFLLGDLPGHPFRGNQWTGGQSEGAPDKSGGGGPVSPEEKERLNTERVKAWEASTGGTPHSFNPPRTTPPEGTAFSVTGNVVAGHNLEAHVPQNLVDDRVRKIKDDKSATPYEKEHAEALGRAEALADAMADQVGASIDVFKNKDGSWKPDVQALHEELIHKGLTLDRFKGPVREHETNPTATYLAGPSGAGKSTLHDKVDEHGIVHINNDDIKQDLLRAYGLPLSMAAFVHEESDYIAKRIMDIAIAQKKSFVLDGTLKTQGFFEDPKTGKAKGAMKMAQESKAAGYTNIVHGAQAPVSETSRRVAKRYIDEEARTSGAGRFVPGKIVREHEDAEYVNKSSRTYYKTKTLREPKTGKPLWDRGTMTDTGGAKGTEHQIDSFDNR